MIGTLIKTSGKFDYKYKVNNQYSEDNTTLDSSKGDVYIYPKNETNVENFNYFLENKIPQGSTVTFITNITIGSVTLQSNCNIGISGIIQQTITYKYNGVTKRIKTNMQYSKTINTSVNSIPTITVLSTESNYYFVANSQVVIIITATLNLKF